MEEVGCHTSTTTTTVKQQDICQVIFSTNKRPAFSSFDQMKALILAPMEGLSHPQADLYLSGDPLEQSEASMLILLPIGSLDQSSYGRVGLAHRQCWSRMKQQAVSGQLLVCASTTAGAA